MSNDIVVIGGDAYDKGTGELLADDAAPETEEDRRTRDVLELQHLAGGLANAKRQEDAWKAERETTTSRMVKVMADLGWKRYDSPEAEMHFLLIDESTSDYLSVKGLDEWRTDEEMSPELRDFLVARAVMPGARLKIDRVKTVLEAEGFDWPAVAEELLDETTRKAHIRTGAMPRPHPDA